MTCSNCGKAGHFFRGCTEPITSLGIIAFRRIHDDEVEWLLIRRRVSIGFIELLRGKYELGDLASVQVLVDQATLGERGLLTSMTFSDLWKHLWGGQITRRYQQEFEAAEHKFGQIISDGFLSRAIHESSTAWAEPEWGFPKGRRGVSETELDCALRETHEETGVESKHLRILEGKPLIEEYYGSNGIPYRYCYWLAEAPASLTVSLDSTNLEQQREVGDVRWCSLADAMHLIRPYNKEKRAVLAEAAERILDIRNRG